MSKKFDKFHLEVGEVNENEKKIPWSKDHQLKLDDFQGKSEDITKSEAMMVTTLQPVYTVRYHGSSPKEYEIINLRISAFFAPQNAWINPSFWPKEDTENAVKFYQGSFDLAEELARKAQTDIETKLYGKRFPCKGRSKSEIRKRSELEARKMIFESMKSALTEFARAQLQYKKDMNSPEKFKQNYTKYKKRFDDLRMEIEN